MDKGAEATQPDEPPTAATPQPPTAEVHEPPPAPPVARPPNRTVNRIGYGVAAFAVVIVGGSQLLGSLADRPACDGDTIQEKVRALFRARDIELTELGDMREVSSDGDSERCAAHIETADEIGEIEYSIAWKGWSYEVAVEKLDVVPRGGSRRGTDSNKS
jgi:hypothetical protein